MKIPDAAKEVLVTLDKWRLPVDPFAIATEEEIELAPGTYGDRFDARIEYLQDVRRFVIYYREPGPGRPEGRVRFSIAHELGHFYLPEHRDLLLGGMSHNSLSDFGSSRPQEREADEFAASLLMPEELFVAEVRGHQQKVCNLKDISRMAEKTLKTSVTSTARRYCQCGIEACSIVYSKQGRILWALYSEDMQERNMKYIAFGEPVPRLSLSARLWAAAGTEAFASPVAGSVDADVWFSRPYGTQALWEEAMSLGNTGFVLTLLTPEDND